MKNLSQFKNNEWKDRLQIIRNIENERKQYAKNRPKYIIAGSIIGAGLGLGLTPVLARKLSGKLSAKEISKLKKLRNSLHPDKPLKFLPSPKGMEQEALTNAQDILKNRNRQFIDIQNRIKNNDSIPDYKKDITDYLIFYNISLTEFLGNSKKG
jgi:hypothetical protein